MPKKIYMLFVVIILWFFMVTCTILVSAAVNPDVIQPQIEEIDDYQFASSSEASRSGDLIMRIVSPADADSDPNNGIQTSIQTFYDMKNSIDPQALLVGINIVNNSSNLSGAYIEIPLDCIPDGQTPPYENYTMDTPVFTFDGEHSSLGSLIDSYQVITDSEGIPQSLRLDLKENAPQGSETVTLRFLLAPEYVGNIPQDSTAWLIKPVYNDGFEVKELDQIEVMTTAKINSSATLVREAPSGVEYRSGTIAATAQVTNRNPYESWLDEGSFAYVAIPNGYSVQGSLSTGSARKDLPDLGYVNTRTEEINGIIYNVYQKALGNDSTTWSNWNHNQEIGFTFERLYLFITPPDTLNNGDIFFIYSGAELKRMNGETEKYTQQLNYIKEEVLHWTLSGNQYHGHSSGLPSSCGIKDGDIGNAGLYSDWIHAGYSVYDHQSSTRNMGMGTAEDVRLELYSLNNDSARLNYNQVEVSITAGPYPDRKDGPEKGKSTYFKVEFEITNAVTNNSYLSSVNKMDNKTFTVTPEEMPDLQTNEYISKVIVRPMGLDGNSEGSWPPGNLIGLKYQPKAWPGQKWPDGSDVPMKTTPVTMEWTLYSNHDNEGVYTGRRKTVNYIVSSNAVSASAEMISTNSTNRTPGDTVNYNIIGHNERAKANNNWVNPYLIIAVPRALQLLDPGASKDFIDLNSNVTHPGIVSINKMAYETTDYVYYELQVQNYNVVARRGTPAFQIPLAFQVADGTGVGTYPIPFVIVSSQDLTNFYQIDQKMNNLTVEDPINFNLISPKNYTAIESGHTPLTVSVKSNIFAGIKVKAESTNGSWSTEDVVPVFNGETVSMQLVLKNTGNTTFHNVKVYNILPYDGDSRGSTGTIVFEGVSDPLSAAKVWYTDMPVGSLPGYNSINLETFDPQLESGWTDIKPTDLSAVTAIYIDYGSTEIKVNENLTSILEFKIPDGTGDTTAYNQFRYYAQEKNGSYMLDATGESKGFSTEALTLKFDANVPSGVEVLQMPADITKRRVSSQDMIQVPAARPTRIGYEFDGWREKDTDPPVYYVSGNDVAFAAGVKVVTLEACWKPITVKVIYNVNGGTNITPNEYSYQYDQVLAATDLPQVNPTKEGFIFKGWSFSDISSNNDFGIGTKINFINTATVYAVWEELFTLSVSKSVHGLYANKLTAFTFTAEFKKSDGTPVGDEITYEIRTGNTLDKSGIFTPDSAGKWSFELKDQQTIVFKYFSSSDQIQYVITETPISGFTPYVNSTIKEDGTVIGGEQKNSVQGTIGKDQKHNAESFQNLAVSVSTTGVRLRSLSSTLPIWMGVSLVFILYTGTIIYKKRFKK